MIGRQRTGAIVCPSCGRLVDVTESQCPYCGRARPGLFGFVGALQRLGDDLGFSMLLVGSCIAIYALMLWYDPTAIQGGGSLLGFLSPSPRAMVVFGASGSLPVGVFGRWWTPLSAGLLHAGLLHLFFNMMSLRNLAPGVAHLYGPGRMVLLFSVSSVTGFLTSTGAGFIRTQITGQPPGLTLGASAGICGLLAALIYYGRRTGNRYIKSQTWSWLLPLIAFGFLVPNVDNWAHLGGFAGGWLLALWLDPLRDERADHVLWGIVSLLACFVAVAASVATVML